MMITDRGIEDVGLIYLSAAFPRPPWLLGSMLNITNDCGSEYAPSRLVLRLAVSSMDQVGYCTL